MINQNIKHDDMPNILSGRRLLKFHLKIPHVEMGAPKYTIYKGLVDKLAKKYLCQ